MNESSTKEVELAPRIIRVIAGINFVIMFLFAMLGAFIASVPPLFIDILAFLQVNDPALFLQIINEIQNSGLTVSLIVNLTTMLGTHLFMTATQAFSQPQFV